LHLIALYQWTADEAGVYAGLEAVGAALIVVATILAIVAAIRSSFFRRIEKRPDASADKSGSVLESSDFATPAPSKPSASDLVEPMAFFLSKVMKFPRAGNPVVDEFVGNLMLIELPSGAPKNIHSGRDACPGIRLHVTVSAPLRNGAMALTSGTLNTCSDGGT
jgi:hypothetical protein